MLPHPSVRVMPKLRERPNCIVVHVDDGVVEMPCGSRWRMQRRIMRVMTALARKSHRLVRVESILTAMYGGPDDEPEWPESSMRNAISHLRRSGLPIVTRYGQGYILEANAVVVESKEAAA